MANIIFNKAPYYMLNGTIDMDSHTFKMILCTSTYTPDAAHEVYDAASPGNPGYARCQVANGNGYTTSGKTLTDRALSTLAGATKFTDATAADMAWTSATFTARYAVIYDDTSSPKYLVALFDFGADKSVTAGTFQVNANASGFFTVQQA